MLRRNKEGVSAIIGTIMTLIMVVVLFGSIFWWVTTLEGPSDPTTADFTATYQRSGSEGYLNITHAGGEELFGYRTKVHLYLDETGTAAGGGPLTIGDGGIIGNSWLIGQTWRFNFTGVTADSELSVLIVDTAIDDTIWESFFGRLARSVRPLIYRTEITPDPVARGEDVTIKAWVYDQDNDLSSVRTYLLPIQGGNPTPLTYSGSGDLWTTTATVGLATSLTNVTKTIRFNALDSLGNQHNKTETVNILHENTELPYIQYTQAIPNPVWEGYYFNITAKIWDEKSDISLAQVNNHSLIPDLAAPRGMADTQVASVYRTSTPILAPGINATDDHENFTLTVHAEDDSSHMLEHSVTITIVNSSTPIIRWALADPNSFTLGDSFKITAKIEDQEDDVDTVWVDMSGTGLPDVNLTRLAGTNLYQAWINNTIIANLGDYNVTVYASDAQGHEALAEPIFLRILDPTPGVAEQAPIITSVTFTPNPVYVNGTFTVQATVIDLNGNLNTSDVKIDASVLGLGIVYLNDSGDGKIFRRGGFTAPATPGDYLLTTWANDTVGSTTYTSSVLIVDPEPGILTDPDIAFQDLRFSDNAPVHAPNTEITITAWIVNLGGTGNYTDVNATVRFIDEGPEGTTVIGDVTTPVFTVPSPVFVNWHPETGGTHNILVRMLSCTPAEDSQASAANNQTSKTITVRPSILLVDDDHAPADGSLWDTTSWMRSALNAADFIGSTAVHTVTSTNGPRWDTGDHPLVDYDIVIWMTGYEVNNTLTAQDRSTLETFLDHNRSLWLISEGAMNDPNVLGWNWGNGTNVLHVDTGEVTNASGPVDPIAGEDNHTVTSGKIYNSTERGPYSRGDYIGPDIYADEMFHDGTNQTIGISYNQSYKTVFFSWEFSKLLYPADQATLTYNILKWLSGISEWTGEDIGISQILIDPNTPDYNDEFTITARFRNNGANGWNVKAGFYVDGVEILLTDPRVNTSATDEYVFLNPNQEDDVYLTMVADLTPGFHTIEVVADPENEISETNELNNRISSDDPIFDLELYVRFTLLVVDDDESANNGGMLTYNVTNNVTTVLDELGYNYTLYVSDGSAMDPNFISKYKGTIWLCGEDDSNTLTANDQAVLRHYIQNESGQLWLIGQDILWDLTGGFNANFTSGDFAYDILHVDSVVHNALTPSPLIGVDYNEITHGMQYQTDSTLLFTDQGDRIMPTSNAEGMFWQDASQVYYSGVEWESSVTGSKVVFMPWEYAFLSGLYQRPLNTTTRAGTRAVIWSDGFETGNWNNGPGTSGQWTEAGATWRCDVDTNNPHTGSYSAHMWGGGTNPEFYADDIDLSAYSTATITFWWFVDNQFDGSDELHVYTTDDGGANWDWYDRYETPQNSWQQASIDLHSIYGILTNQMGIRFRSDADNNNEDCYIDDISLDCTGAGPSITSISVEFDPTNEQTIQTLYATAEASAGNTIQDMEYWSDQDATHTAMTPDNPPLDNQNEDATATPIDITGWADGTHWFQVRAQDNTGTWGNTETVWFDIITDSPTTTGAIATPNPTNEAGTITINATVTDNWSNIMAAEWWWEDDGDAGAGNNNPMTPQDGSFDTTSEVVEAAIAVPAWVPGTYRLYIRGQDVGGRWNTTITDGTTFPGTYVEVNINSNPPVVSNVQVTPDPTDGANTVSITADVADGESTISEAEAFIDIDPGQGLATPLTVPLPGAQGVPPVNIVVSGSMGGITSLSEGSHMMYVRARQTTDGAWGTTSSVEFQVTTPDVTPPMVLFAQADPNPTAGAFTITITAIARDDKSSVVSVQYKVDNEAWTSMDPTDGTWDELVENADATLNITGLSYGLHNVMVKALDAESGQWSANYNFTLHVTRPTLEERLGTQTELAFMVMKFFEHPETRPELRVVQVDINITDQSLSRSVNPMLGESYLVSAEIYNPGGEDANAIVKLLDGENIIRTQSVFVPSHQKAMVEGIWTPQMVGERNIIAKIAQDPDEVFVFNNEAYQTLDTYFFHDDMENGPDKWTHDDTILLVNGEAQLDFLNPPINTTIGGDFQEIVGFNWTDQDSHSENKSMHVGEIGGIIPTTADALVSMVIDNSRSMIERTNASGDTWLDVGKEAAKNLVSGLSDNSAVSIWVFGGANEIQQLSMTPLAGVGRTTVLNSIDSISSGQMTAIWDAIGSAYMDVRSFMPTYPTLTPAVVVLSDGADYQSNDHSGFQIQKLERASDEWAPWHDMEPGSGFPLHTNDWHIGKYNVPFNDPLPGVWRNVTGAGGGLGPRKGLLNADMAIYTIGLALEHHNPPDANQSSTITLDAQDDVSVYTGAGAQESGTVEYNLWRISNTSGAEYYYSPTSDELFDIFGEILTEISEGALARSPPETGESKTEDATRATSLKYVTTETFDLSSTSTASLSFYHKYSLAFGYNGGVVMVGTYNSGTSSWLYEYVTPLQLYPGNLWVGASESDDVGKRVLWAYNGVSASGLFDWEYAEVDLSNYVGEDMVRIKFQYYEYDGGSGGGWWLDDIQVKVSRDDATGPAQGSWDQWNLTNEDSQSGSHSWVNKDDTQGFKGSLDNSLYTQPIDLTNALEASLSFYTKFNFNEEAGRPPDGFRVEISADNGVRWRALTLGVRSAWGVSGTGEDDDDGVADNMTYTGLDPDGDGWVAASTLTRVTTDLSGWAGSTVMLRFRVAIASDDNSYFGNAHYEVMPGTALPSGATAWPGLWIDDVIVGGLTVSG